MPKSVNAKCYTLHILLYNEKFLLKEEKKVIYNNGYSKFVQPTWKNARTMPELYSRKINSNI